MDKENYNIPKEEISRIAQRLIRDSTPTDFFSELFGSAIVREEQRDDS